jgi:hypothetical protein
MLPPVFGGEKDRVRWNSHEKSDEDYAVHFSSTAKAKEVISEDELLIVNPSTSGPLAHLPLLGGATE